ncbi:hypothetical protein [Streptomyces sp. NBC_00083]|uniref:hypothetical protein n=1 Tax=Streptomyces sp. NBC_00083 TaxID=2975647 RepID=UPI002256978C|nr:hypothetical protein [Streptomyces sp. NBC_00083]MCX5384447.1 hypothetical protein [Streptomyces sp. NBC_00083]
MNIQSTIGNSPLVQLKTFDVPADVRISAEAEFMNPGGSIKDRMVSYSGEIRTLEPTV